MNISYSVTVDNDLDYVYDEWGQIKDVYSRGRTVRTMIKDNDNGLTIIHEGGSVRFE